MKKTLLIAFLFVSVLGALAQRPNRGGNGQNQKPKSPEERASFYTQMMTKRLKLNGEQNTSIGNINKETAVQIAGVRQEARDKRKAGETVDMKPYRERIKTLNQTREDKTLAVLNAKQKGEYALMKEEMKKKAQQRKNNKGKGGKVRKFNKNDKGLNGEPEEDELDTEDDDL